MQELNVVIHWHDLLNKGLIEEVKKISDQDIELGGPKGTVHGIQYLDEWYKRSKLTLKPESYYKHKNVVVVEELGKWHDDKGEVTASHNVVSAFEVQNNKISRIMRYDNLKSAFNDTGLTNSDKVNI